MQLYCTTLFDTGMYDVMQQLTAVIAASQSIQNSQKMKKMLEVSKTFLFIATSSSALIVVFHRIWLHICVSKYSVQPSAVTI